MAFKFHLSFCIYELTLICKRGFSSPGRGWSVLPLRSMHKSNPSVPEFLPSFKAMLSDSLGLRVSQLNIPVPFSLFFILHALEFLHHSGHCLLNKLQFAHRRYDSLVGSDGWVETIAFFTLDIIIPVMQPKVSTVLLRSHLTVDSYFYSNC